MNESKNMIVDAKAGRALAQWEAISSQQTVRLAKELARQSDSKRVTVEHFQQAAEAAIEELTSAINEPPQENDQRAA